MIGLSSLRQHRVEYKADGGVAGRRELALSMTHATSGAEMPAAARCTQEEPRDKNGAHGEDES